MAEVLRPIYGDWKRVSSYWTVELLVRPFIESRSHMKASKQATTIKKAVIDLHPGDILVGKQGGHSVVEDSSDHSGHLGFMRIETEHGQLYMELDTEVTVLENPRT